MNTVEDWFGPAFAELHPLLRRLHREGGVLQGDVHVAFGRGLAGAVGRRLAQGLGIPAQAGDHPLTVTIASRHGVLHWDRRFGNDRTFASRFVPHGRYPDGWWEESSGPIHLRLRVVVVEGAWLWRDLGSSIRGVPLPRRLLPRTSASKAATADGRYRFNVAVALPVVGTVLSYGGILAAREA